MTTHIIFFDSSRVVPCADPHAAVRLAQEESVIDRYPTPEEQRYDEVRAELREFERFHGKQALFREMNDARLRVIAAADALRSANRAAREA